MKAKITWNLLMSNDVSFEIYFGKIGEIRFPKNHSVIFKDFFTAAGNYVVTF